MFSNKKLILTISLLSVVVFIGTTAMQAQQQQQDETPKNLNVLPKDITHDQLEKVMRDWSQALGVRCGFCHARNTETNRNDFASDAKPEKQMAREMMKMTEKINKKYFKMDKDEHGGDMMAAIACITCHHGAAHPDNGSMRPNTGGDRNGPPPAGGNTPPKQ